MEKFVHLFENLNPKMRSKVLRTLKPTVIGKVLTTLSIPEIQVIFENVVLTKEELNTILDKIPLKLLQKVYKKISLTQKEAIRLFFKWLLLSEEWRDIKDTRKMDAYRIQSILMPNTLDIIVE